MGAGSTAAGTRFEAALAVADAVLYEGYLLYPYRRSSAKNRVRWQFGVLVPPAWAAAHDLDDMSVAGSAESPWQQTECLLAAPAGAAIHLRLRFLHVRRRRVEELAADGTFRPAASVEASWGAELTFDEAEPREFDISASLAELLDGVQRELEVPGAEEMTPLPDAGGRLAGRLRRRVRPLRVRVSVRAQPCGSEGARTGGRAEGEGGAAALTRLRIRVENICADLPESAPREQALAVSPLAAHVLAAVDGGSFVSLLDPPEWAEAAARACVNVHTFPVMAGPPGTSDLILSSPILLPDHPQVAPESPGDLHDAAEIDEILSLRALTLTDAEKREARATDARAAVILDRIDAMPPEVMSRLHGAIRSLAAPAQTRAGGPVLSKGSKVRLRPHPRGTDAQDAFLAGRTATVEAVLEDLDGGRQLAVTLDGDPGADLDRWYGRFRYFSPEEVEPLDRGSQARASRARAAGPQTGDRGRRRATLARRPDAQSGAPRPLKGGGRNEH